MSFVPSLTPDGNLGVTLRGEDGSPVNVDNGALEANVNMTLDIVGVGNIFGFDNNPFGFVAIAGNPEAGNTVTVNVGSFQKVYTVEAGDTLPDIAAGLAALFNADASFDDDWLAGSHNCALFIRSLEQGRRLDGISFSASTAQGSGSGLDLTATANDTTLQRLFKQILVEVDDQDWRVGRIGVFGEVGTRTRADNPIFLSVRRVLATKAETVFFDKNVADLTTNPKIDVAFITDILVGNDQAAELLVYRGSERDAVENFTGDGSTKVFNLPTNAVRSANHVTVTVDGSPQTLGADFDVIDSSDGSLHSIEFSSAPGNGEAIVVTYDAVDRVVDAFVQASSSQQVQFGAPIKLEKGEGHFLIASVTNKAANAAACSVNANGFFELERGAIS